MIIREKLKDYKATIRKENKKDFKLVLTTSISDTFGFKNYFEGNF